jgi:DNA-binding LytR/AlgR family response regulator
MVDTETMRKRLSDKLRGYLSTPLWDFYSYGVNRLMLYCLLACFFVLAAMSAWAVYISPHFLIKQMAFTTVYALHNAMAYAGCHLLMDAAANRIWPAWAGYENRTVGRQWAIWSGGLVMGFVLHRTLVRWLVHLYAWQAAAELSTHPGFPPSHLTFALAVAPVWIIAIATVIYIALKRQQAQQRAHASAIQAILSAPVMPQGGAMRAADNHAAREDRPDGPVTGTLVLNADGGELKIPHAQITHITVEDHYSRIFYSGGNGDGLRNVLIRLPLKKLMQALPRDVFIQIHRSHVVNLSHVKRMEKTGRECRLVLSADGIYLPVSRYRLPHLKPLLEDIRVA